MTLAPSSALSAATNFFAGVERWRWTEAVFWVAAFGSIFVGDRTHLIMNEIAILALFALSLDLILGYAGIVSLGHAAFFGFGAYATGIAAKYGMTEPLVGIAIGGAAAAVLGFFASFMILRGSDLTRLMVTLGVALVIFELANKLDWLTGGADGLQGVIFKPVLGVFDFDLYGKTAHGLSTAVLFVLFLAARRLIHSPFGHAVRAIRDNRLRATAIGIPVDRRLVAIYTIAAFYAGAAGALLTITTAFTSLDVLDFHRSADVMLVLVIGGAGQLYGGIVGAVIFKLMQDRLAVLTPQYWQFWIGLFLVLLVLIGRERLLSWPTRLLAKLRGRT